MQFKQVQPEPSTSASTSAGTPATAATSGTSATAATAATAAAGVRTVLFFTALSDTSIPGTQYPLASLLPRGHATFAEHVVQACAAVGLRDIELVVSEHPEPLRALLGNGARWGLRFRWHLVRDGATPYGLLREALAGDAARLLVGHGHQWLDAEMLSALLQNDGVAVLLDRDPAWTGWCSLTASEAAGLPAHADAHALADWMFKRAARQGRLVQPAQHAEPGTAAHLLAQQAPMLSAAGVAEAPATWLRRPWGLMSPEAHVHPQALMKGPVLVGPGCVVNRGATVGPNAVLCQDVMLAPGAVVRSSLVLANTYVSGELLLEQAVAQGASVQHTAWDVRSTLPGHDALLLPLQAAPARPGMSLARSLTSRLFAAGLGLFLLPLWPLLALGAWVSGQPAAWQRTRSVLGVDASQQLRTIELRVAPADLGWCAPAIGFLGALLDVAQGRRRWFGVRPRSPSQWYALRRDWQRLFAGLPIGVFHAPAWTDDTAHEDSEMWAVADAYFAVAGGWRERMRILLGLLPFR